MRTETEYQALRDLTRQSIERNQRMFTSIRLAVHQAGGELRISRAALQSFDPRQIIEDETDPESGDLIWRLVSPDPDAQSA